MAHTRARSRHTLRRPAQGNAGCGLGHRVPLAGRSPGGGWRCRGGIILRTPPAGQRREQRDQGQAGIKEEIILPGGRAGFGHQPLLPVPRAALAPPWASSQRGCWPASLSLWSFLPSWKALQCTAVGILRQGQALQTSVLADRSRMPWRVPGTGGARACRMRRWRWQVDRVVATCPHAPRASLRSQGRSSGLSLAGLCAADRDAVEGFPWPGRPRGWAPLGSRSPGLPLAAAVLPSLEGDAR